MIEILDPKDCCGCNACVQRCPKECITMHEDKEGFLYPVVDKEACIDCGLCEKVCPVLHPDGERKPLAVYAAKNKDEEIRRMSSSGGVFTLLAEQIINEGGVVFGARFNEEWDVVHASAETKEGLTAFRGSKYVQSRIDETFKKAESFLKEGKKVLFSGTPCQIAGLRRFLHKDYENLLTVDFVCHGVPSPGVWRQYLEEEIARQCVAGKNTVFTHPVKTEDVRIRDIQFRNKRLGWKKFSFSLTLSASEASGENSVFLSEPLNQNLFMRGFLSDLYLRPSCYACPSKSFKSGSDITIGDFWGIERVMPEMDDDKGTSLVLMNTQKGKKIWKYISLEIKETKYEVVQNPMLEFSAKKPFKRNYFYQYYNKESLFDLVPRCEVPPFWVRVKSFLKRHLNR